ncbi:MAG: DUF4388 domain-containing protein [Cyanobacteria bacterium J06626_18]
MMSYCFQASQTLLWHRILLETASQKLTGYLSITDAANDWTFYLEQGKLIYASSSLNPFGRLERHLRYLQVQIPALTCSVRAQIRLLFETFTNTDIRQCDDYEAICWLVKLRYLTPSQAADLIAALTKDVLETASQLHAVEYTCRIENPLACFPRFCGLDLCIFLAA